MASDTTILSQVFIKVGCLTCSCVETIVLMSAPDYQIVRRQEFSKRLIHAMQRHGLDSYRGAYGVDARKLSALIGVSYPMVLRYVSGTAFPEDKTIEKIAEALAVDPWWLIYGEKQTSQYKGSLNEPLFLEIFEQMEAVLGENLQQGQSIIPLVKKAIKIYYNLLDMEVPIEEKIKAVPMMVDLIQ